MRTLHLLPALALLAACSSTSNPKGPDEVPIATSPQARVTQPNVPAPDATALREGNTAFATDLYRTLAADPTSKGKNLFFSPHSISIALAMTYAGASGDTATEMASALHYTLPQDRLHPAFNALDLALTSRGENAKARDGKAFRLRVTNSTWGAPQTKFRTPYLDALAQNYGAGIRLTDFAKNPEAARGTINAWVEHETEDRIKELLPQGSVGSDTRLVLVNAIYFNAAWAKPFEKTATQTRTFHGAAGDTQAALMAQSGQMPYAKGDGWQAVSIPYDGKQLSFVAVLPSELGAFETGFSAEQAAKIASTLSPVEVNLELPRFKIAGASVSLKTALAARGMKAAFDPDKANFSGMAPETLYISDVIHQAFVSVDEAGTEAAAATAVIAGTTSIPEQVVNLTIDRPFVFFVRDDATGAILFLGRVLTV